MLEKLEEKIKEKLDTKKFERCSPAGASCSTYRYLIDNDKRLFVKTSNRQNSSIMFAGELESIKHIRATKTVRVPEPFFVIHDCQDFSAIVMEELNIESIRASCARKLGENLASLHDYNNKLMRFNKKASKWIGGLQPSVKLAKEATSITSPSTGEQSDGTNSEEDDQPYSKHGMRLKAGGLTNPVKLDGQYPDRFIPESDTHEVNQFGFDIPTSCGYIPQVNEWSDDWVSFYARHRLDKPIRSLLSDHGDRELSQQWSQLQLKVDKFFLDFGPRRQDKIVPALLHGDLWSGNVAQIDDQMEGKIPVIYDPSSFYGHSEYDFGISRMFGGVPKEFEIGYFEILPKKKLFEQRNKLYQLFHHLNHWDHFGSGYRPSSLNLIKQLNRMV